MDRNFDGVPATAFVALTFPARGTWIEIQALPAKTMTNKDVPRKGNVDRNNADMIQWDKAP